MTTTQLFIPKKLKIGFRERTDTFTKKLAYVIYYDEKNVLRKQKSWDSWRDKNIEPIELDNNPMDGFVINKNVERYNWSHFSNNRSYIRIYDSRGVEFEITPENLIGILMHSDCSRRVLEGKYVYAWSGKELVLLPTNSQEYVDSVAYTKRLETKISARELTAGLSYKTKKGEDVIYMGRYDFYQMDYNEPDYSRSRHKKEKVFIFVDKDEKIRLDISVKHLSLLNSLEIVANYAELSDRILSDVRFYKDEKWEMVPVEIDDNCRNNTGNHPVHLRYFLKTNDPNIYKSVNVFSRNHVRWNAIIDNVAYDYKYHRDPKRILSQAQIDEMVQNSYFCVSDGYYMIDIANQTICSSSYTCRYEHSLHSEESIKNLGLLAVQMELSNNKKVIIETSLDKI
jgi:hypothetical protein